MFFPTPHVPKRSISTTLFCSLFCIPSSLKSFENFPIAFVTLTFLPELPQRPLCTLLHDSQPILYTSKQSAFGPNSLISFGVMLSLVFLHKLSSLVQDSSIGCCHSSLFTLFGDRTFFSN
ncbi:hypothetical protein V6N13_047700 [Hibiscus sabdariffa]